jgi:predicted  nucleic acid-binding Zn-ribbon protein
MEQRNYKKDLQIDPDALDLEWVNQPARFMFYAQQSAHAKDVRDRAKEKLEVVKAQVDGELRAGFAAGEKKPTEAAIASMVLQSKEYQDANEEFMQAKLEADLLQAAVSAMDQRKSALENLVRLHSQQYFAGPKEPRDLSAAYREQVREQHQEVAREDVQSRVRRKLNPEP